MQSLGDERYGPLLEPLRLGPVVAPNRFYQTPYCTGFGTTQPKAAATYRATRAEGGWGVINTEICSVHPETDLTPWVDCRLWDDEDADALALTADAVHEQGSLIGIQLLYGGATGPNYWSREVGRGPSAIPSEIMWDHTCYEMDHEDIRQVRRFYVEAARRAYDRGFDIINICVNGYISLPQQFLLPFHNRRDDEYGGSLQNRSRFLREVLEDVRDAVSDRCAVTMRINMATPEPRAGAFDLHEEGEELMALCDPLLDFWDLDIGGEAASGDSAMWGVDAAPARFFPENWQEPWLEKARSLTSRPIVGVGRFTSPDEMLRMVTSGTIDMVGAARPGIADPFLPLKIAEGRQQEIRECIGCNFCVSRYWNGTPINCTQNPTAGEEYRRGWHPEVVPLVRRRDLTCLVVGAGPSGLECATTLAERGAGAVHLVDADGEMGGHLSWLSTLPGLQTWRRVVEYRELKVRRLDNLEFVGGRRMSAREVLDYGADLVVLATGARWARDGLNAASHRPIPGALEGGSRCFTPEDLARGGWERLGQRVLIYDCDGYVVGSSIADQAAQDGHEVTLVTPQASVAKRMFTTDEGEMMLRRLHGLGVSMLPGHHVTSVEGGRVRGFNVLSPDDLVEWDCDSVVLVTQRVADTTLWRSLVAEREPAIELYRVGDCVAPRSVGDCVFDGHRMAMELDVPQGQVRLVRERVEVAR